jgi:hypothetical protein
MAVEELRGSSMSAPGLSACVVTLAVIACSQPRVGGAAWPSDAPIDDPELARLRAELQAGGRPALPGAVRASIGRPPT